MKKYMVSVDVEIEADNEEEATIKVEDLLEDHQPDVILVDELPSETEE